MADTATKTFANQTPEDQIRNRALAEVSRRNSGLVRAYLENLAKTEWENYNNADEDEGYSHPNASLFYALVGFPWVENEDGEMERDPENYMVSVAKHYNAPDMDWLVEDAEEETITLFDLKLDENNNPIPVENPAEQEEGQPVPFKNEVVEVEVPINQAVREYALGYREDKAPRTGLTVKWLLTQQPGIGSGKADDMIAEAGIGKSNAQLRELRRRQFDELLYVCGAEDFLLDEEDEDYEDDAELTDEDASEETDAPAESADESAEESQDEADAEESTEDADLAEELDAAAEEHNAAEIAEADVEAEAEAAANEESNEDAPAQEEDEEEEDASSDEE